MSSSFFGAYNEQKKHNASIFSKIMVLRVWKVFVQYFCMKIFTNFSQYWTSLVSNNISFHHTSIYNVGVPTLFLQSEWYKYCVPQARTRFVFLLTLPSSVKTQKQISWKKWKHLVIWFCFIKVRSISHCVWQYGLMLQTPQPET